jgi:glycosyltransferase involved in cell wall biosynthesis
MKKVVVFAICDFVSQPNGGEVMLLNNFLSSSVASDVEYYLVGMSFNENDIPGVWTEKNIGNKIYKFLPVTQVLKDKEKTYIPFRFRVVNGIKKYWRQISKIDADFWYIHSAEIALSLKKTGRSKIVYHVHGDPCQTLRISRFPLFRGEFFTKLYWKVIAATMKKSDSIVWAAKKSWDLYLEQQPEMEKVIKEKSCVIHSSFDNKLKIDKNSVPELKDRKHLITVGRLANVKRIDFIITSLHELIKQGLDVDLIVCGDGEEMNSLQKHAESLNVRDKVLFMGLCDRVQIATLLDMSDCFLFASENEAMSLVVLESLYMGTPVVSTNVGDISQVVVDSENGFIVDGYELEKYVESIKTVLENGKLVYLEKSKNSVVKYTPERMATEIDGMFV